MNAVVDRRTVMSNAVVAVTAPTTAAAVMVRDASADPTSSLDELPVQRCARLAAELADALNDYMGGRFHAVVMPSGSSDLPVIFTNTKAAQSRARPGEPQRDPLSAAIGRYYEAMNATEAPGADLDNPPYLEPMEFLEAWDQPALNRSTAITALRLAIFEGEQFASTPLAASMMRAVEGYLERAA